MGLNFMFFATVVLLVVWLFGIWGLVGLLAVGVLIAPIFAIILWALGPRE
jgi:hypothetical protein